MRRAGQRNVSFAREKSGGRIETHPARAGQKNFGPGVQVREVACGAGGSFQRFDVGRELDQIARNKARGQAEMTHDLNQQPSRIAAGTRPQRERLLAGLHA